MLHVFDVVEVFGILSSPSDSSKTTMYRLKMLEQHLLQLEGSSPEYTTGTKV